MASDSKRSGDVRQIVLLGLLAVAVVFLFYQYYVSPLRGRVEAVNQRILGLRLEVQQARAFQARWPELQEQIRLQQARFKELQEALPTSKETAEIVRLVEDLAKESNLHLKSFTPQQTVQNDFYQDWPILLSIEGTFDNLGIFLERVSAFDRVVNVDNLSIRPLAEENRTRDRTIAATLTATTYVFQEQPSDS